MQLRDFSAAVVHRPLFSCSRDGSGRWSGSRSRRAACSGLAFVVLVAGVWRLSRDGAARFGGLRRSPRRLLVLCVPAASAQAIAGLSDVAGGGDGRRDGGDSLTTGTGRVRWGALAALAALTVLTKPSVLAPLAGLAIAVLLAEDGVDGSA